MTPEVENNLLPMRREVVFFTLVLENLSNSFTHLKFAFFLKEIIFIKSQSLDMNNKSSRHHYIPQFYIKGYLDTDGKFFVYDKLKDRIIQQKQAPKSIFFEKDRNSIFVNGEKDTFLEEQFYQELDQLFSSTLKHFVKEKNSIEIHTEERIAILRLFVMNLYWRIPFTDEIFANYFDRMEFVISKNDTQQEPTLINEKIRRDESMKKIMRALMTKEIINFAINLNEPELTSSKLFEFPDHTFLISDNPILFKTKPNNFNELVKSEFIFPLSSNRVYSSLISVKNESFNFQRCINLNSLLIWQASRYVGCPIYESLDKSIRYFKVCQRLGILPYISNQFFNPL